MEDFYNYYNQADRSLHSLLQIRWVTTFFAIFPSFQLFPASIFCILFFPRLCSVSLFLVPYTFYLAISCCFQASVGYVSRTWECPWSFSHSSWVGCAACSPLLGAVGLRRNTTRYNEVVTLHGRRLEPEIDFCHGTAALLKFDQTHE